MSQGVHTCLTVDLGSGYTNTLAANQNGLSVGQGGEHNKLGQCIS